MRSKWNGVPRLGNRFVSFVRASGRGEAAWAGERNDSSETNVPHDRCSAVACWCPVGCPGGVPVVANATR